MDSERDGETAGRRLHRFLLRRIWCVKTFFLLYHLCLGFLFDRILRDSERGFFVSPTHDRGLLYSSVWGKMRRETNGVSRDNYRGYSRKERPVVSGPKHGFLAASATDVTTIRCRDPWQRGGLSSIIYIIWLQAG